MAVAAAAAEASLENAEASFCLPTPFYEDEPWDGRVGAEEARMKGLGPSLPPLPPIPSPSPSCTQLDRTFEAMRCMALVLLGQGWGGWDGGGGFRPISGQDPGVLIILTTTVYYTLTIINKYVALLLHMDIPLTHILY